MSHSNKKKQNFNFNSTINKTGSGVGSTCTSARGSLGDAVRAYCPHVECCHAHEEQEPAELKKIKKVNGKHCRRKEKKNKISKKSSRSR